MTHYNKHILKKRNLPISQQEFPLIDNVLSYFLEAQEYADNFISGGNLKKWRERKGHNVIIWYYDKKTKLLCGRLDTSPEKGPIKTYFRALEYLDPERDIAKAQGYFKDPDNYDIPW